MKQNELSVVISSKSTVSGSMSDGWGGRGRARGRSVLPDGPDGDL